MTELTVSMPVHNCAGYVGEAIKSILNQEGVAFELIIVDDGSSDNTRDVLGMFNDGRVRVLRNDDRRGVGYCHNMVLEKSCSPFVAHVGADGLVLPGAFRKLVETVRADTNLGLAICYFFEADERGCTTRDALRQRRSMLEKKHRGSTGCDYELIAHGEFIGGLRVYRREALHTIGTFTEDSKFGEDFETALRSLAEFDSVLVPEFLYAVRTHQKNTGIGNLSRRLKYWYQRVRVCRKLLGEGEGNLLASRKYEVYKFLASGLNYALGLPGLIGEVDRIRNDIGRELRRRSARVTFGLKSLIYDCLVSVCSRCDIDSPGKRAQGQSREKHVGYYIWHFPTLSQTFIHREVNALRKAGLWVTVFARAWEDVELLEENAKSLMSITRYIDHWDKGFLAKYKGYFFRKDPVLFVRLFIYVLGRTYGKEKCFKADTLLFHEALYLAGLLKERGVNHIHAPWADRYAFVSLIASRFVGASYSVQVRAHDIHRKSFLYALPEKLEHAQFTISNCRYNEAYLRSFLNPEAASRVRTIYEGIDVRKFVARPSKNGNAGQFHIVSVARAVEQKGLTYLLRACKDLAARGYKYRCDIIGGPEEPLYTNHHLKLRVLHRELGLEDHVVFLGAQPFAKVVESNAGADMFVLPCVIAEDGSRDITPNSLIEAMAMGLAVISTNITGIPEIVEDGVSGILVEPADELALADAMMRVIEDGSLREQLGKNARRRVEEKFDIRKNILQYRELFQRLG